MTTFATLIDPTEVNIVEYGDDKIGIQFLDDDGNQACIQGSIRQLTRVLGTATVQARAREAAMDERVDHQLDELAAARERKHQAWDAEQWVEWQDVLAGAGLAEPIDEGPF